MLKNKFLFKVIIVFLFITGVTLFFNLAHESFSLSPSSQIEELTISHVLQDLMDVSVVFNDENNQFMDIPISEKFNYYNKLKMIYGDDVLKDILSLDPLYQNGIEKVRHQINDVFDIGFNGLVEEAWHPESVLTMALQECSARCKHCFVFSSPLVKLNLSEDDLSKIYDTDIGKGIKKSTLSGGEIFLYKHLLTSLEKYPIRSFITNCSWATNKDVCRKKIKDVREALMKNPNIDIKDFSFYVSLDKFHLEQASISLEKIANVFETIYEEMPEVKLLISRVDVADDNSLQAFFDLMAKRGFLIKKTEFEDIHATLKTNSFVMRRNEGEIKKEFFIDYFQVSVVSRATLMEQQGVRGSVFFNENKMEILDTPVVKSEKYKYVVSPDGRVTIYDMFFIPPGPYFLGNFKKEGWEKIISRVSRDPIAITVRTKGLPYLLGIAKKYFPEFTDMVIDKLDMSQQFLFMMLLDPTRRVFFDLILLQDCLRNGELAVRKNDPISQAMYSFLMNASAEELLTFTEKKVKESRSIFKKYTAHTPSFSACQKRDLYLFIRKDA